MDNTSPLAVLVVFAIIAIAVMIITKPHTVERVVEKGVQCTCECQYPISDAEEHTPKRTYEFRPEDYR